MNKICKIITVLAVGFTAGALIGILTAPDKGTETLKKFTKNGKKVMEEWKEELTNMIVKANNLKQEIAEDLRDPANEVNI